MGKAQLTKAQAEALEKALECCEEKITVIENHINGLWSGPRKQLKDLSLETLIVALYIGYEIEPTNEEKLIQYIQELHETDDVMATAKILGVMKTLEILNIELKELEGVSC